MRLTRLASLLFFSFALCSVAHGAAPAASAATQFNVTLVSPNVGHWELHVENTNTTAWINGFQWTPPPGLKIVNIDATSGGRCTLSSSDSIQCAGSIQPEPCFTCEGGLLTVYFTGKGFEPIFTQTSYGGFYAEQGWAGGTLQVTSTSTFSDLPLCKPAERSTARHPCAKKM
jgi:hypothetical protein